MPDLIKFLFLAVLTLPALAAAAQDADFIAAREAFRAGDIERTEQLAPSFRHSPLEPYLTYYQLRLRLETADVDEIQAFLARPDDTPVIDRLRGEWLKVLGKYGRWDLFSREYPALSSEDTELTCYALQARDYLEGKALSAARALWLSSGTALPDSCNPVFDDALAEGLISTADIWQRIRLALEGGNVSLARQLSERLPEERRLGAVSLSRAAADPERYLKNINLKNATDGQRMEALFALQRLAKQLPHLANRYWLGIAEHFTAAEQRYLYGWLGYEAARKHDARALEWFRAAGEASLTQAQRAWRVRAALRAQEWMEVWVSIAAMPAQQQGEGAWRYWKARALKKLGRMEVAKKILVPLSTEYNFYGLLAADELNLPIDPGTHLVHYEPSPAELSSMLAQPSIQRALALYRMDLRNDGLKEWTWAIRKFDDKQLLTAAEIARRNEIYDRAIYAADRTVQLHDFNLRYLAPYREDLKGHIQDNGLEEAWVYGLMRQESRFVVHAKSNVGASGLMQVMPATARWLAAKLGMKDYRHSLISQMETNLKLGTYYMKTVLLSFDNNPVLASAAYNAGPARARRWRGETALEGAIYVETIPYDETRDYVKKVMSNTVYYAQLFGQPAARLKQRLGVIAPRNAVGLLPPAEEEIIEQ
jgi:soluble lytic murein transglycosylase